MEAIKTSHSLPVNAWRYADVRLANAKLLRLNSNPLAREQFFRYIDIAKAHLEDFAKEGPVKETRPLENVRTIAGPHLKQFEKPGGKHGYVYIISDSSGLCKVGRAKDPDRRFMSIQSTNPTARYLVALETSDMFGLERALHVRYKDQRVRGEWFALYKEDLRYLTSG